MNRLRLGMVGTLLTGALLSATALSTSAGARALRRELAVFLDLRYDIVPKYTGISKWEMTSPHQALEIKVITLSRAPTEVTIHSQKVLVHKGSPQQFASNRTLGKTPKRTPYTLSVAEGRNRCKGIVQYLK